MSRARQASLQPVALCTIPRIELSAAKLAVLLALQLTRELSLPITRTHYWSDCITVLHYIRSTTYRFQRFVSNKVAFILQYSNADSWHFVPGALNIADVASRGSTAGALARCREWFASPSFLSAPLITNFEKPEMTDNLEIKKLNLVTIVETCSPSQKLLNSTSDWFVLLRRLYIFTAFGLYLQNGGLTQYPPTALDYDAMELSLW